MRTLINLSLTLLIYVNSNSYTLHKNDGKVYFLEWRKATTSSIANEVSGAVGSDEKSLYKNRLAAFNSREGLAKIEKSLRYKFWQKLDQDNVFAKNFYILETMNSGEMVTFENRVIYLDRGEFVVDVYSYNPRTKEWIKYKSFRKPEFSLDREQNKVTFKTGLIHDDIIVSKFQGLKVLSVDYYVTTTIKKKGGVNVSLLK